MTPSGSVGMVLHRDDAFLRNRLVVVQGHPDKALPSGIAHHPSFLGCNSTNDMYTCKGLRKAIIPDVVKQAIYEEGGARKK